jgi:hypothetical protein
VILLQVHQNILKKVLSAGETFSKGNLEEIRDHSDVFGRSEITERIYGGVKNLVVDHM